MRNHIQRQKLTSKSASRHSNVNISSSKHGPNVWYFYYFDLKTCFAPQPHALFEHLNFQKCSFWSVFSPFDFEVYFAPQPRALFSTAQRPQVLRSWPCSTFWLGNVLRATAARTSSTSKSAPKMKSFCILTALATAACNFSSLIWPDGSAPAALASLLLDPPEPQNIGQTQCLATFLPFRAPASSFFWLFLFSDLLPSHFLFSDSSHLCFSICPYCLKFDFQISFDYSVGIPLRTCSRTRECYVIIHVSWCLATSEGGLSGWIAPIRTSQNGQNSEFSRSEYNPARSLWMSCVSQCSTRFDTSWHSTVETGLKRRLCLQVCTMSSEMNQSIPPEGETKWRIDLRDTWETDTTDGPSAWASIHKCAQRQLFAQDLEENILLGVSSPMSIFDLYLRLWEPKPCPP